MLLLDRPCEDYLQRLRQAAPRAEILWAESEEDAAAKFPEAEVVLGHRWLLQTLSRARRLRWLQSNSVGVEWLVGHPAVQGVTVTCARGVYDDEMADHAVALVLALARGLPVLRDAQARREWRRGSQLPPLRGRRALILGAGGVGTAVASRLAGFGVECEGACRLPRSASLPFVALHHDWRPRLSVADLLILALPLTPLTRGCVGFAELQALPEGALLVNVARGGVLDEEALRSVLPRLGGAALDVFAEEPLPPDHWLWAEEKVLVSPHLGRSPETGPRRLEGLFVENLRRYAAGEPLLHVVDLEAGY